MVKNMTKIVSFLIFYFCIVPVFAKDTSQWSLPENATARFGKGHINNLVYSPDGKMLAVGSSIGVWLYDANTGEEIALLAGHTEAEMALFKRRYNHRSQDTPAAFSPDGKTLLSSCWDWNARLWDVNTRKHIGTHAGKGNLFQFLPDGKILDWSDNKIQLWETRAFKDKLTFANDPVFYASRAASPDGMIHVRENKKERMLYLWNMKTGKPIAKLSGNTKSVRTLAFSPDRSILAGGFRNAIRIWDTKTGKQQKFIMLRNRTVMTLTFSHNGNLLASGNSDKSIHLWETETWQHKVTLSGHNDSLRTLAFSPDDKTLASGSYDGTIRFWNTQTGKEKNRIIHNHLLSHVILSSDGKTLVNSEFGSVFLWDIDTSKRKTRINSDLERMYIGRPYGIDFSADGTTLSQFGRKGEDKHHFLWNLKTDDRREPFKGQFDDIIPYTVSKMLSPDGKLFVAGKSDGRIQFWNTYTGALEDTLTESKDYIYSMAYSQDGKLFAAGNGNQTIHLWDAISAEHIATFKTSYQAIKALAFSPDSSILASGTHKEIHLWNLETGESISTVGHKDIEALTFSPDGKILASGSRDTTIRLWDTNSGRIIDTLIGHSGSITSLAFRSQNNKQDDGNTILVSLSEDKTAIKWNIKPIIDTDAVVEIVPHLVESPAVGEQLTFNIDISKAENITGYQVTLDFDTTALRFVSGKNGSFLPENATLTVSDTYPNRTKLESTSSTGSKSGEGVLASITYEVLDEKDTTVRLRSVLLEKDDGSRSRPNVKYASILKNLGTMNVAGDPTRIELPKNAIARYGQGRLKDIKYFPDNSLLAVSSSIGIWLYDTDSGNVLTLLKGHTKNASVLAFSPDGDLLACGGNDATIRLWDTTTFQPIRTLKTNGFVAAMAFSPNEKTLATGSSKSIQMWSVRTWQPIFNTSQSNSTLADLVFSPDGTSLASASIDDNIKLWDAKTGQLKFNFDEETGGYMTAGGYSPRGPMVAFSPDGNSLASTAADHNQFENKKVKVWNTQTGKLHATLEQDRRGSNTPFTTVQFSKDGQTVICGSQDGTLRHWNPKTGENVKPFGDAENGKYTLLPISPNNTTLVRKTEDDNFELWDIETGEVLITLKGFGHAIPPLNVSLVDKQAGVFKLQNKPTDLWEIISPKFAASIRGTSDQMTVPAVAYSSNSATLVGKRSETVTLWDTNTNEQRGTFKEDYGDFVAHAFSPDGRILAVATRWGHTIRLWNVLTGEQELTLQGHAERITSITFSPDGATIASAEVLNESEYVIRIWDAKTGENLNTIANVIHHVNGQRLPIRDVAFTPDGKTLASIDVRCEIQFWDVETGKHKSTISADCQNWVESTSLVFSPDGTTVISVVDHKKIYIWDVKTGRLQDTFIGHTGSVVSLTYSADGTRLMSGSKDGTVLLWKMQSSPTTRLKITPLSLESPPIGRKLTFNVNMIDAENVNTYKFTCKYDSDALRYMQPTDGNNLNTTTQAAGKNTVLVTGNVIDNGTIATLTFEVKEPENVTLTITDVLLTHKDGKETRPVESHAWIIKPELILEDANRDWQVNAADLEFISSRLGQTGKGNSADINGDGIVDIADLVLVRKALYGTAEPNQDSSVTE